MFFLLHEIKFVPLYYACNTFVCALYFAYNTFVCALSVSMLKKDKDVFHKQVQALVNDVNKAVQQIQVA